MPWGIYGIHGTNKDWSIGGAESHGCLRMHNRDVEELWDLVPEGVPVVVSGPWELPCWQKPAVPPFGPGQNGQAIVFLQLLLRRTGFDPGVADGRCHPGTDAAVHSLERSTASQKTGWPTAGFARLPPELRVAHKVGTFTSTRFAYWSEAPPDGVPRV